MCSSPCMPCARSSSTCLAPRACPPWANPYLLLSRWSWRHPSCVTPLQARLQQQRLAWRVLSCPRAAMAAGAMGATPTAPSLMTPNITNFQRGRRRTWRRRRRLWLPARLRSAPALPTSSAPHILDRRLTWTLPPLRLRRMRATAGSPVPWAPPQWASWRPWCPPTCSAPAAAAPSPRHPRPRMAPPGMHPNHRRLTSSRLKCSPLQHSSPKPRHPSGSESSRRRQSDRPAAGPQHQPGCQHMHTWPAA
mmetsp:Transcript_14107/g.42555  ORF Transcript_14107/g.42555 Transcript_14107/m.42555 type:complete len:249 (-) Transcript_14107:813-1559(-)